MSFTVFVVHESEEQGGQGRQIPIASRWFSLRCADWLPHYRRPIGRAVSV